MTAVNVLITQNYATLITDTLARTPIGADFHASKSQAIPHMRIAVATRGPISALEKATRLLSQYAFDFASARSFLAANYAELGMNDAEIFVAGWDNDRPAAFMISATNTGSKIFDITYILVTPTVPEEALAAFGDDPLAGVRALLDAQAGANDAVGGYINVTQVGPAVIESYAAGIVGQ